MNTLTFYNISIKTTKQMIEKLKKNIRELEKKNRPTLNNRRQLIKKRKELENAEHDLANNKAHRAVLIFMQTIKNTIPPQRIPTSSSARSPHRVRPKRRPNGGSSVKPWNQPQRPTNNNNKE